jgi:hypothetical protein
VERTAQLLSDPNQRRTNMTSGPSSDQQQRHDGTDATDGREQQPGPRMVEEPCQ